ncbi:hypothetical protein OROGR_031664 [Orobanche gracilis]
MKKETSGGSKNPKPKILGATPLQVGEGDASRLVGGIVEKGFSAIPSTGPVAPSAAPRPTVLPFPVARHRSHGPHWAPEVVNVNVINDNYDVDNDVGEKEDFDVMEVVVSVAKPVERREKNGLDFSQWREIVKNGDNPVSGEKKMKIDSTGLKVGRKEKELYSDNWSRKISDKDDSKLRRTSHADHLKEPFMTMDDKAVKEVRKGNDVVLSNNENIVQHRQQPQNEIAKSEESTAAENVTAWQSGWSKEIQIDLKMQKSQIASGFAPQNLIGREQENIESQIDAENRAQLAKMSTDEIAEAQAELMAKLDPELINALKKRGQSKVKRHKFSLSDVAGGEADGMQSEKNTYNLTASSDSAISENPEKFVPGEMLQDENDKASRNSGLENHSMWDAWSKRVEHVRDLRFSLDGNIISSELAHVSDTAMSESKASSESGYNADNVSERDFIRTEGDPGAVGYTIKEAVTLTRSVIPGQRTLALHLIAAVLDRAISGICQNQDNSSSNWADSKGTVDWEAVWALALGPEPELALALRMSLDDNHNSVVLACVKAIQCALSCDMTDIIFGILEKTPTYARDVCTAPVFRSKPNVNFGFLRGGFWKYNTKPSNIRFLGEELDGEKDEGEPTIQDDIVVAGQDFAAGLVRMGILPRICYLLETDPVAPLEECLISILIAIARHSPTCAAAVSDYGRLVQTIVNRFASKEQMEINSSKIKSVTLLKVLARVEKNNCLKFINEGILQKVTWHLYRYPFSLDQWVKSGKEACKLSSTLIVEQLRLWKVFIHYGYCISEFSNLFASLCIWFNVPTFEKLIATDTMNEYCAVTKEAYLLLDVLAARLPNFYSHMHEKTEKTARGEKSCSWNFFGSIIDLALEWIKLKSIPHVSRLFNCQNTDGEKNHVLQDSEVNSLLWVISSVLNMLSSLLKATTPEDITSLPNGRLPWLPDFVSRVGLEIIKNGYLRCHFSETSSFVEYSCLLRTKNRPELALSLTCCLQGLVQVVDSVDMLIRHANLDIHKAPSEYESLPWEDKVLANGIFNSCVDDVQYLLTNLMKSIIKGLQLIRPVEVFGRGGPAPGVGVGWGASSGGYWAINICLAQQDARLLVYLLEISEIPFTEDSPEAMQILNCALTACLLVGPWDNSFVIDKLLKFIFRVPVLKYLYSGIRKFLSFRKGHKSYRWNYEEDEYTLFASVLAAHFRNRWLSVKKKNSKSMGEKNRASHISSKKEKRTLETIYEGNTDVEPIMADEELSSLRVEWAHQRLPLPAHWFLSAISTVHSDNPPNFLEVAKGGLLFLLGTELLSGSPVEGVLVVWKLHAMSVTLLSGMEILGDEKSRCVYEILQNVYGEIVDAKKQALSFEKEIHKNYSAFVETLVEQFAAESYGDELFGRQIAMYLHRSVEASVRLAAWNALSNAHVLELVPPVDKCFTKTEGFLEPLEDNERILEAYVKSWVSGALDKAANRSSVTFSLVLHHLSTFIFHNISGNMISLRNKLVKSLLRDYSSKHQHEGMMVRLICYMEPHTGLRPLPERASNEHLVERRRRLQLFKEICDGHLMGVEKLESVLLLQ